METPIWVLMLLCLCVPAHCDCQRDCLSCGFLMPENHAFNTLVCLVECESEVSPAVTWELCRQSANLFQPLPLPPEAVISKRGGDEAPVGLEVLPETLRQIHHMAQALGDTPVATSQEESVLEDKGEGEAVGVSKRFGGFLKSKQGYRKLMDPGRSLQKRYGGFIGIRKSARKWNNQKRFSEFLRQYLSMSTRPSGGNSMMADIGQQGEM